MFDPEKVGRWEFWANADEGDMEPNPEGDYVRASDYDQLLALYRASEERIRTLARMFNVCDGGRYLNDWQTKADLLKQQ